MRNLVCRSGCWSDPCILTRCAPLNVQCCGGAPLTVVQQLFDGEILEVRVVLHSSRRVVEACAKAAILMSWLAFHDSTKPSPQPRGSLPKKIVGYLLLMKDNEG